MGDLLLLASAFVLHSGLPYALCRRGGNTSCAARQYIGLKYRLLFALNPNFLRSIRAASEWQYKLVLIISYIVKFPYTSSYVFMFGLNILYSIAARPPWQSRATCGRCGLSRTGRRETLRCAALPPAAAACRSTPGPALARAVVARCGAATLACRRCRCLAHPVPPGPTNAHPPARARSVQTVEEATFQNALSPLDRLATREAPRFVAPPGPGLSLAVCVGTGTLVSPYTCKSSVAIGGVLLGRTPLYTTVPSVGIHPSQARAQRPAAAEIRIAAARARRAASLEPAAAAWAPCPAPAWTTGASPARTASWTTWAARSGWALWAAGCTTC